MLLSVTLESLSNTIFIATSVTGLLVVGVCESGIDFITDALRFLLNRCRHLDRICCLSCCCLELSVTSDVRRDSCRCAVDSENDSIHSAQYLFGSLSGFLIFMFTMKAESFNRSCSIGAGMPTMNLSPWPFGSALGP